MKKKRLLSLIFAVMLVSMIFVLDVSANEAPNLLFEKFVRTEEPTGPRYSATLSREIYDDEKLTEYGFMAIALEKYEAAELSASTFTLDADADFIKGVNYGTVGGKKVDKHLGLDDDYVTFSCVITNIAEEYFDEGIVIRAYAVYDGETYYSAMFKSSYFVMAKKVKKSGEYDELDSNGKELIDYIIASCTDEEGGDDEEIVQPEDPKPEKDSGYRFVSNYDIALDEENNWRHYYELYNPYTGEKEYDVPGIESAKKASLLGDAVEAGTLIKLDGTYVDGSTAEDYSYSWLGTSGRYDTNTIVPYTENITCPECLADYFEVNDDTSIVINSATPVSVLSYSNSGGVFKWGSIRLGSSEEMLDLEKSVQCYNEKALDRNGNYVTKYFKFPKFIYKSTGEYEGGAEVCDFILIVANGDEECALGEKCEMHENNDKIQNIGIVSNYDLVMTDDFNWTINYEVYVPYAGKKIYVPSSLESAKASSLKALESGTIIKLVDGIVDETNPDTVLGTMSEENLVWIKQADDDGTMTVVPYDQTASCITCAEEYMSDCEEGVYRDMFGNEHTSGKLKTAYSTVFTRLSYGSYDSAFYKWSTMNISNYSELSEKKQWLLSYNDESLDKNGNYVKTVSKYVKAFVCATGDDTAYFVIVIVNGNEGAAYNVECEKHTDVTFSAETEEITETPEPERSGPAIAGASLTAEDL